VSTNGRIFTMQFHPEFFHLKYIEQRKFELLEQLGGRGKHFKELQRLKEGNIRDSVVVRQCMQRFICQ
jgi:GMP synthase-like glutamine amidotransferase